MLVSFRFDDLGIQEALDCICQKLGLARLPEDFSPEHPSCENDRRSLPRLSHRHQVSLTPVWIRKDRIVQVGESMVGTTTTISRSGIGLEYFRKLPSTTVVVTFDGDVAPSLVVEMCWQHERSLWKGGGRFVAVVEPLHEDAETPFADSASC